MIFKTEDDVEIVEPKITLGLKSNGINSVDLTATDRHGNVEYLLEFTDGRFVLYNGVTLEGIETDDEGCIEQGDD